MEPTRSNSQDLVPNQFFDTISSILREESHTESEISEFVHFLSTQKIRNVKKFIAKLYDSSSATIFSKSNSIKDMVDSILLSNQFDVIIEPNEPSHPFASTVKSLQALKTKFSQPSPSNPLSIPSTPVHQTQHTPIYSQTPTPVESPVHSSTNLRLPQLSFKGSLFPSNKESSETLPPPIESKKRQHILIKSEEETEELQDTTPTTSQKNHVEEEEEEIVSPKSKRGRKSSINSVLKEINMRCTITLLSHLLPLSMFTFKDGDKVTKTNTFIKAKIVGATIQDYKLEFFIEFPYDSKYIWSNFRLVYSEAMILQKGLTTNTRRTYFKFLNEQGRLIWNDALNEIQISSSYWFYVDEIIDADVRCGNKFLEWQRLLSHSEHSALYEKLQKIETVVNTELEKLGDTITLENSKAIFEFLRVNMGMQHKKLEHPLQTQPLNASERHVMLNKEAQPISATIQSAEKSAVKSNVGSSSSSATQNLTTHSPKTSNAKQSSSGSSSSGSSGSSSSSNNSSSTDTIGPTRGRPSAKRVYLSKIITSILSDSNLSVSRKLNLLSAVGYLSHLLPLTLFWGQDGCKYQEMIEAKVVSFSYEATPRHLLLLYVECPVGSGLLWPSPAAAFLEVSNALKGEELKNLSTTASSKCSFKVLDSNGRSDYNLLSNEVRLGKTNLDWEQLITKEEDTTLFSKLEQIEMKMIDFQTNLTTDFGSKLARYFLLQNAGDKFTIVHQNDIRKVHLTASERNNYSWKSKHPQKYRRVIRDDGSDEESDSNSKQPVFTIKEEEIDLNL